MEIINDAAVSALLLCISNMSRGPAIIFALHNTGSRCRCRRGIRVNQITLHMCKAWNQSGEHAHREAGHGSFWTKPVSLNNRVCLPSIGFELEASAEREKTQSLLGLESEGKKNKSAFTLMRHEHRRSLVDTRQHTGAPPAATAAADRQVLLQSPHTWSKVVWGGGAPLPRQIWIKSTYCRIKVSTINTSS